MITGGAGFIGSTLGKSLAEDGHDIIIVDNFSTGSKDNIDYFAGVYDIDLSDQNQMEAFEALLTDIDVVYHFAASIGVELVTKDPGKTLLNSFDINNNVFPLFDKYRTRVIYSSTSEVYGETTCIYGSMEQHDAKIMSTPRGSYASAKLTSEFLLKSYRFPYVITRFFNVVGPAQVGDYGHVFPRFINAAINGHDLVVYNNGSSKRSFCDIRDAIKMLKLLIDPIHTGETYNIGNADNVIMMKDLAEHIIEYFKSNSAVVFKDKKNEDILCRFPNTEKMDKYYKAKFTLDDIIRNIYETNFNSNSAS